MYVGPGQANSERDILSNRYGSARYAAFLNGKPLNEFGELNGVQGQTSEVITQHIFMMKEHKRLTININAAQDTCWFNYVVFTCT